MSELSRKARKENRAKAQRMASTDPKRKVDASSWTPPEPLNANIKTGARPVRPRIYKQGGRVQGDRARRGDQLPREIANAQSTRNTVGANKEAFGSAHEGGFKNGGKPNYLGGTRPTGGRLAKAGGGSNYNYDAVNKEITKDKRIKPSEARADGGRIKRKSGKTNINIRIDASPKPPQPGMLPPQGVVRPPPAPPPMPMGGPPPDMPPPSMAGGPPPMAGPPLGGPPLMPRARGGRTYRSAKDMDAGALSGEGRLEKTEIQARKGRRAGGKTYRSAKDMDAGSMSALGRLEKSEIQAHKR